MLVFIEFSTYHLYLIKTNLTMKNLLLFLVFSLFYTALSADEVNPMQAQNLASNFYRIQNGFAPENLTLVEEKTYQGRAVIYTFQVNEQDGYVIVSGDDQAFPVLGYSLKGSYVFENKASQFSSWIDKYYN